MVLACILFHACILFRARFLFHPAGFMKKAWKITLRKFRPLAPEYIAPLSIPIWPYRYEGSGLFLANSQTLSSLLIPSFTASLSTTVPPLTSLATTASKPTSKVLGQPSANGQFYHQNHLASYLYTYET
jgi:hypothetical protein